MSYLKKVGSHLETLCTYKGKKEMKAVILAGGRGTRFQEETSIRPKPMIEIGGRPILWHIMKIYSAAGINDFIVCCGHKGFMIKEYFANYLLHHSDVTFDLDKNDMHIHNKRSESWKATLIDTGENTMTGGRLLRVAPYLKDEEHFCFTYGDGVGSIDIASKIDFHKQHGKIATLTAVKLPGRFGALKMNGEKILSFEEKPDGDGMMVNGGFFVLGKKVFQYLQDDSTVWEREPLEKLAIEGELMAFKHYGFWHPMDTLRDKKHLEELWNGDSPPWKVWK